MKKYFTVVTAVDKSLDGKSFYSGQAKTEKKSVDIGDTHLRRYLIRISQGDPRLVTEGPSITPSGTLG